MKYYSILILFLLLTTSCQFFETEKISSDIFYEDEMESIDWKEVDQYPSFVACESYTEKLAQKSCFETTLSTHLYQSIQEKKFSTVKDMHDTIPLSFTISREGVIEVTNIHMDSLLTLELPLFERWIMESVGSLPNLSPAYKRGIPVQTQFTLPIVLKTEGL